MELDHAEAWDLAHFKQGQSNLARCYIDLRNAVRLALMEGVERTPGGRRLQEIEDTVADSTVRLPLTRA
jgi:hypothetical protein